VLSVLLKMDKIECREIIKFFVKEGLTPNETDMDMSYARMVRTASLTSYPVRCKM
jgi:hypothetical protein